MSQVNKENSQYRRDMLEWRRAQSAQENDWRRSRQEKEDKDRRVILYVKIDKMSYGDAYAKVYGY